MEPKKAFGQLGLDWFIFTLIAVVFAAYHFPQVALIEKPFSLTQVTNVGIIFIFFFYGLKLQPQKLIQGLYNWKMHLLIQATTFLIFPLLILILKPVFVAGFSSNLWLGLFFLAALPSTVSTSVVMVSIAGGNIPGAIFNASISALIGLVITPIWMSFFISPSNHYVEASDIAVKLSLQVLLPVILGIFMNKYFGTFAEKNKIALKTFDQIVILLIVYTSFARSFNIHIFESISFGELVLLGACMLMLFLLILFFVKGISHLLHFNRSDMITVMFCGSKKSLVHGTLMSGILFAGNPITGIILLPILLYHPLQIMSASLIANRMSQKTKFLSPQ